MTTQFKIFEPEIDVLSRSEKVLLISSILSGIGNSPYFDENELRQRIYHSLKIAGEIVNDVGSTTR